MFSIVSLEHCLKTIVYFVNNVVVYKKKKNREILKNTDFLFEIYYQ